MDRKTEEQLRLIKSALQTGKRLAGAKRRTYKGKTLIHRSQQEKPHASRAYPRRSP